MIKSVDSIGNTLFNYSGDTLFYFYTRNDLSEIIQKGVENKRINFIYDQSHKIIEENIFDSIQTAGPFQTIKINYNKDGLIDNILKHENSDTSTPDVIYKFEYKDSNVYKLTMATMVNTEMNKLIEYSFEYSNGKIERMITNHEIFKEKDTINLIYDNTPNYFKNYFTQPILQASTKVPIDGFLIIKMFSKSNLIKAKFEKSKIEFNYNYPFNQNKNVLIVEQKMDEELEQKMDEVLMSYSKYFYEQVDIDSLQ